MTDFTQLQPHDPLPEAPAVVLMQRFEEDDPRQTMMELIVLAAGGAGHTSRLLTTGGLPTPLEAAKTAAAEAAEDAGIAALYFVDRTAGPREREVTAHDGDRSVDMETLVDSDLEDGEPGGDMRDRDLNQAPRRF